MRFRPGLGIFVLVIALLVLATPAAADPIEPGGPALANESNGTQVSPLAQATDAAVTATGDVPTEVLNQTYGGNGTEEINDIVSTDDGNYLLVGRADWDGAVRKVTPAGKTLWQHTYGTSQIEGFSDAVQTPDGGYTLVGYSDLQGTYDGWLVKINKTGDKQWSRRFGGSGTDVFDGIAVTDAGRYLLAGTNSTGTTEDENAWVVKTTQTGSKIWAFPYYERPSNDENFFAIEKKASDEYLLAGQEYVGGNDWDAFAVKIDSAGRVQWEDHYGHPHLDDWFNDVAVEKSGKRYFAGTTNGVYNNSNGAYDFADGYLYFDVPRSAGGVSQREQSYQFDDFTNFQGVAVNGSQGALVAGEVGPTGDFAGPLDATLMLVNQTGSQRWRATRGGPGDEGYTSALVMNGSYYYAGATESFGDATSYDSWFGKFTTPNTLTTQNSTATVTLTSAPGGLKRFEITVASTTGTIASVTGGRLSIQTVSGGSGQQSVRVRAADLNNFVVSTTSQVSLFSIDYRGDVSRSDLTLTVHTLTNDSGGAIPDSRVSLSMGQLFTQALPGSGGQGPPKDPDGDGTFEDINGDGQTNFDDAVALAFVDDSQLSQSQIDAIDRDGDGDIDFDDAIDLSFDPLII